MRKCHSTNVAVLLNAVKAKRLARGWSMRDLAKQSGVDHVTVFRAETGKEPSLTSALRLAEALDTPVEDLWALVD